MIGITFISFMIMHMAPGDPTTMFMDPAAGMQDMTQMRKNLGLDKPIWVQYAIWLKNTLSGDMGYSMVTGKPVLTAIMERLPATLLLALLVNSVNLKGLPSFSIRFDF